MVMCTHLHFDHIGWNTRLENGKWVPTFPKARYIFGKRDFEYFKDNPAGEEFHYEAFLDSIVPVMEAGLGEIVEENFIAHREIGNGVWLEPAFGHSPGCCTVNARADGPDAIFWGDVIHHPVQLIRHDLPFAFDMDSVAASKVRKSTMERAADSDTMCFPAHFRRSSAGQVKRDGDAFRYEFLAEELKRRRAGLSTCDKGSASKANRPARGSDARSGHWRSGIHRRGRGAAPARARRPGDRDRQSLRLLRGLAQAGAPSRAGAGRRQPLRISEAGLCGHGGARRASSKEASSTASSISARRPACAIRSRTRMPMRSQTSSAI